MGRKRKAIRKKARLSIGSTSDCVEGPNQGGPDKREALSGLHGNTYE